MTKYNIFNRRFEKVGLMTTHSTSIETHFILRTGLNKAFEKHIKAFFKENGLKLVSPLHTNVNNRRSNITTKTKRFDLHVIKQKAQSNEKYFKKIKYVKPQPKFIDSKGVK